MKGMRVHLLGSLLFVALVVGACGSAADPESIARLEAARQQAEDLGTNTDALADATDEQRECIDAGARELDLDDLVTMMTDPTVEGERARVQVMGLMIGCIPDIGRMDSFAAAVGANLAAGLSPDADLDDDEQKCMVAHVVDNAADPAEALAAGSSQDSIDTLIAAFGECLDETSYAVVTGAVGTGAQAYGEDPLLDDLYDKCEAGDGRACDLLFVTSTAGSEYNALALDCAGRGDGISFCYSEFVTDEAGTVDPTSPGLATLAGECEAGDMLACDLLFVSGSLGSELERIGFTCGGRIAVPALPNCRTRFAE